MIKTHPEIEFKQFLSLVKVLEKFESKTGNKYTLKSSKNQIETKVFKSSLGKIYFSDDFVKYVFSYYLLFF